MSPRLQTREKPAPTPSSTPVRTNLLQRKCACGGTPGPDGECAGCRRKRLALQRGSTERTTPSAVPPIVHDALRSPGRPLDTATRTFMQGGFGYDLSRVRVHTDEKAAESARAVGAAAYTIGRDVVFGTEQYQPGTSAGRRLLAHELTHVTQQADSRPGSGDNLTVEAPDSGCEREAEANAARISMGQCPLASTSSAMGVLQRQPEQEEAPIDRERGVRVVPRLQPDLIDLSFEALRGRHRITATGGLSDPLNLLGVSFLPIVPSQLTFSLGYDNRCNAAFQSALVSLQQTQQAGGPIIDFGRNPWQVGVLGSFRSGSVRFDADGTIGFVGNRFDSVLFTLTIATGVSTAVPPECTPTPRPTTPTEDVPPPTPGERTTDTGRPGEEPRPTPEPSPQPSELPTYTLYFFYDTTVLRPESNPTFRLIQSLLQTVPTIHVMLTGHASLEGTEEYNLKLSQNRADAMRAALTIGGVTSSRVHTFALGEYAPAVPEPRIERYTPLPSVESVRNLNRRVEVRFFDPTGSYGPSAPPTLTLPTLGSRRASGVERPSLVPRLNLNL